MQCEVEGRAFRQKLPSIVIVASPLVQHSLASSLTNETLPSIAYNLRSTRCFRWRICALNSRWSTPSEGSVFDAVQFFGRTRSVDQSLINSASERSARSAHLPASETRFRTVQTKAFREGVLLERCKSSEHCILRAGGWSTTSFLFGTRSTPRTVPRLSR